MDLFTAAHHESPDSQPLPERLRPKNLDEMLGQQKILGANAPWRRLVESGQIPSLILWGPPGSGKTTFALLLAQKVDAEFIVVNAVETGAKALRELGEAGRRRRLEFRRKTLLFVDEIHRLNKGQQDVLLPAVEKGDLVLVGATTENPSYEINSALLSRCRILVFERLDEKDLMKMAQRAADTRETKLQDLLQADALERMLEFADGDGRRLLNMMEVILNLQAASAFDTPDEADTATNHADASDFDVPDEANTDTNNNDVSASPKHEPKIKGERRVQAGSVQAQAGSKYAQEETEDELGEPENEEQEQELEEEPLDITRIKWPLSPSALARVIDVPSLRYDKTADEHYDTISAFIKSVRGSDPDAAMYYLARMIKGGEDPVFIARRLVILASEDIGNADPRAITLAVSGLQAVELVGWPEAAISLAQVTTYLASAPKSNRSYMALHAAQALVEKTGTVPIPLSLRSAKTSTMKNMGYGKGYKYSHNSEKGYVRQRFLPEELGEVSIYEPTDHGFEKNIRQYLEWLKK